MGKSISSTDEIIARELLITVLHDNGFTYHNPKFKIYQGQVKQLLKASKPFFSNHDWLITDEHINRICAGEYHEREQMYGHLEGYRKLESSLEQTLDFYSKKYS